MGSAANKRIILQTNINFNRQELRGSRAIWLLLCLTFTLVGNVEGSFWSPSLGPTSTRVTVVGRLVEALRFMPRRATADAGVLAHDMRREVAPTRST